MDAFHSLFCHQNVAILEPDNSMIYITQENKHIEDYLDYYCNLSHAPKFAVLIKGKWGCGKTWFIEKYREKLDHKSRSDKTGKKSLYISLYGVSNFSEIEDSIFQQLHPVLSSKQMVVAGKLFKGLLKASLRFDLDVTDDKTDNGTWNISIPDIERMKDKFNDSKFSLLIFDDLERCQIPLEELLGYINSFVDSQELKVVIIANEDEINCNEKDKYKRIKEKIIGQTFEVVPDLKAAVQIFISDIKEQEVKEHLSNNIVLIEDLYIKSECKNLRTINKIILNFNRIFNSLPERAKNHSELIKDILEILIIFSMEIYQGDLVPSDISDLMTKLNEEYRLLVVIRNKGKEEANEQSTLKFKNMFDKYDPLIFTYSKFNILFPNLLWWKKFFKKGIVDESELKNLLPNSRYFQDENTPSWKKLERYYEYSDEEFNQLLDKLDSEYRQKNFENIEIVKCIVKLFFMFSNFGLYPKSKSNILNEAKNYIDFLKNQEKLNWNFTDNTSVYNTDAIENLPEYKEFDDYIKKCQKEVRESNIANEVIELLYIMENNIDDFCLMIKKNIPEVNFKKQYYNEPIFKYFDAQKFVDTICKIPNGKIYDLFYALQARYLDNNRTNIHSWGQNLVEEIDFLEETQNLLLEKIADKQGQLSSYLLKTSNEYYLNVTIYKIKEYKASLSLDNSNDETIV